MRVSSEDFVRAWQAASCPAEVAEKLGMSVTSAASRATYYRQKGIRLKRFSKAHPLDTAALNFIIDGEQPALLPNKRQKKPKQPD